jgi:hypothetical protein
MMRVAAAEEESSAARQLPQKARDLLCVRNCNDPSIHGANRIRLLSKKNRIRVSQIICYFFLGFPVRCAPDDAVIFFLGCRHLRDELCLEPAHGSVRVGVTAIDVNRMLELPFQRKPFFLRCRNDISRSFFILLKNIWHGGRSVNYFC